MTAAPAPNRLLNLDELEAPEFRRVLHRLDALMAQGHGAWLHPSKRWEYPWALERARLAPGSRVLDAGCGGSIFPIYLAAEGHAVHALDRSPPFGLERAYGVRVDYARADLTAMPFADDQFDAVFCISVIEHLGHGVAPAALAEVRRVLRPGGRLLLTTDFYEDATAHLVYEGPGKPFPVDWGFFDEASLRRRILAAEGFALDGALDLTVDWGVTRERMRAFHGYPYTSVGVALTKTA
jgi:SAM-dependent methyltransferase